MLKRIKSKCLQGNLTKKTLNVGFFVLIFFAKVQGQILENSRVHIQNFDESNVSDYTLPKVLETASGTFVNDSSSWEKNRRPEVLKLFEDNVYGQMPNTYDSINYVLNKEEIAMAGKASLKEITITIWKNSDSSTIQCTMFIPNKVKKPVPLFLLINNRGKYNTDPSRFIRSDFWPVEMVIENNYAIAAFHVSDAAPDDQDKYQNGILRLYPEQLKSRNGMRAIGAWAWAASRIMDYFEKDKDIDQTRIAIVGHSRGGKASLWAGAQDQRFAMVISNNSGNTGAALSRRDFGETVKMINDSFPHWFTDNYKKFNGNEDALPIDQHMLISLIAPRPVYVTSASEDLHADPKGTYLSLFHAQEVYNLYGKKTSLSQNLPALNFPNIESFSGYHLRRGVHNLTVYDWKNFIEFGNYHFK